MKQVQLERVQQALDKMEVSYLIDEPLSKHTTFRVGGAVPLMIFPQNAKEVIATKLLLKELAQEFGMVVPMTVLGNGSNVLVADEGLDGIVMILDSNFANIKEVGEHQLFVTAGTNLSLLCQYAKAKGLSGLEFAYGIPGSVGGAVYMNAGAYGGEMKDVVDGVNFVDSKGDVRTYQKKDLEFGYRQSVFQGKQDIILGVLLSFTPADPLVIEEKMKEILSRRRDKQPLEYPSAGSTFKRPEGHFAGQLIQEAGMKGYAVGGAQVSEKHAGFVINKGNATAKDIDQLMSLVKSRVKRHSGVTLEPEVQPLGFTFTE